MPGLSQHVALADQELSVHCCRLYSGKWVTFMHKVLGSHATWEDPMLSKAAESPTGMDLEGVELECGAEQSWGSRWRKLFPCAIMDEVPLGVLSDDELSLMASGAHSEGEAEARGEEDGEEQNQVLGTRDFPTEANGSTPALIDLCR